MKRKYAIITSFTVVAVLVVHFWGAQLGGASMFIEMSAPGAISTNSWIRCLEDDPTSHGYSIYGYLEDRKTDAAIPYALEHIHSDDAYLWLNASTYLGSRGRVEAVPYLIKSLRHTAHRSVDERVSLLNHLTGHDFGSNFESWRDWYFSTSPTFIPDWETSLGHSPHLTKST